MSDSFAQGLIGVTLDGRYRLEAVLGEGGMGSVFRATQLAMDRKVAVKLLKPHLTSDEAALQRFAQEARATQRVDSPHAVKILDFGVTPLRDYYMVLEYLDGRTVQRELEIDGAFAPARVAHIAGQALAALEVAHRQGLIHRDVKPDNLLLMRVGADPDYTKILDFGVAKLVAGAAGDPAQLALTAAGMVFGTPEFMSPEQACGQALDGRSDLYGLAATMFVMLTGETLFEAGSAIEWLTHHARTPAPRLAMARPELAAYPELDDLLQRCLAKRREHRPASAAEMARELAALAPTLGRAPGGPPRSPTTRRNAIRGSAFVPALADTELGEQVATLVPATTGGTPARSRRGAALVAGAVAIAGMIGVAVVAASLRGSRSASTSTYTSEPVGGDGDRGSDRDRGGDRGGDRDRGSDGDRGSDAAKVADTAEPVSEVAKPPQKPAPQRPAPRIGGAAAAAEPHLAAAEEALRAGNQLRQLAEADLALRAHPGSARARFLLGDALIKGGDLDRGCGYLRGLKRVAAARDRARAAGCPDD